MKSILIVFAFVLGCAVAGQAIAQTDTTPGLTSGTVQSDIPAATTGTAPIDSNTPSGEATTGTSGGTLQEVADNNNGGNALIWIAIVLVGIGLIYLLTRRRRKTS